MMTLRWGCIKQVKVHHGFDTKGALTQNTEYRRQKMSEIEILETQVLTEQRIYRQPEGCALLPQTSIKRSNLPKDHR